MIEEIKLVLDSIGDLSGVALWVVGFFLAFKLVVYLSTTGALVYLIKLAIVKLHNFLTTEKVVKYTIGGHFINTETKARYDRLLDSMKVSTGSWIHGSDIDRLEDALKAAAEKENKQND